MAKSKKKAGTRKRSATRGGGAEPVRRTREAGGACRIAPDEAQDRPIPGTMPDSQLGSAIRQLAEQRGHVVVLWTCEGELWMHSIAPPPQGSASQGLGDLASRASD